MSERYAIKGRLARGGIGAIYLAHDNSLDREVAIKRLLPLEETKLNEAAGADSLSREASALAKFQHPNVVTIYSFEEDEEGAFVVTELIKGENLKETIERGALALPDFESLVEQTLDPLITAQELNLLHRDIKPANIMVSFLASGRFQIKLLDFGLAKFSQTPSTQTLDQQGSFLGSIEYLAPEQLELHPLDQRADLYSLGCVYYYTLTQVSPFDGGSAGGTMENHLEHKVADIRTHREDLSDPLASWLMRLINRQPSDRPADARTALKEFQEARDGIRTPESQPVVPLAIPVSPSETGERVETAFDAKSQTLDLQGRVNHLSATTGPRGETSGQRLLREKREDATTARKSKKLHVPLITLAGVVLLILIAFAFMGDEDEVAHASQSLTQEPESVKGAETSILPKDRGVDPDAVVSNQGVVSLYNASRGVFVAEGEPAKLEQSVNLWRNTNLERGKNVIPFIVADNDHVAPLRLAVSVVDSKQEDKIAALHFADDAQLVTELSKRIKRRLAGGQSTALLMVRALEDQPGAILRFDSERIDNLFSIQRSENGLTFSSDARGRAYSIRHDFTADGWLWICQQYDESTGQLTVHLARPNTATEKVIDEIIPQRGMTPSRFKLGRIPGQPATSFNLTDLAIYGRHLSEEERETTFAQWQRKYFPGE